MSWLTYVVEGARIWSDAKNAENQAKADQERQEAQLESNRAQAVLADNNAQLAEWQAADALMRGSAEMGRVATQARLLKGRQIVAIAASGAELGSGTPQRLLTDTDVFAAAEMTTVEHNAAREAWAYRMQALDSRNRAEILRHSKVPVASDPGTAVTASIINSAARLAERSARNG